jgi:hypothetical protein
MPAPQTVPGTQYSGAGAALASIAAALASLAFFRIWGIFSMSLAGPGDMELTGADLAREVRGPIPWLYITPATILLILVVSAALLMNPGPRVRFAYSILLPLAAVTLMVWPAEAIARITHHFSQLQILGEGTMRLTWWWWTYCVCLALVMTFGIIELGAIIRNYMKRRTQDNAAPGGRVL